jgi:enoyl-CoA hydratase/carnithine racemase
MNRPDKKNAITRAMYGAMAAALTQGDADEAVRVHLILGVPGALRHGSGAGAGSHEAAAAALAL